MDSNLGENIVGPQEASPWKLILFDAENALSKGNARLAVILGQTAVEGAVEEFLIDSFRDKRPPVEGVGKALGLGKKKALSYESAVQKANIHKKLSEGLKLAAENDLSKDLMLWYEWQVANATRVACVHHGYSPSLGKARTVIDTYWRIYREHLEKPISNRGVTMTDWVRDSIDAVAMALGQPLSRNLSDLIQEAIPILKKRLVFYNLDWHLIPINRGGADIIAEEQGSLLILWLKPDESFDKKQMLIADVLVYFKLLSEDYPYAIVSSTLPPMVSRTGWEVISDTLTKTVLQLPGYERIKNAKFPVDDLAKESLKVTRERLLSPDYLAPGPNDIRSRTLPLEVMALYKS